jgi:hypothetical protein
MNNKNQWNDGIKNKLIKTTVFTTQMNGITVFTTKTNGITG